MKRRPRKADPIASAFSDSYRKIYALIVTIPRGKVMTYGQVADAAGLGRAARLVGYALRASPGTFAGKPIPWQRVLGARKRGVAQVAIKDAILGTEQRIRLEAERVAFSPSGGVDLTRYGHRPPRRKSR
jgi:methylated-DNA-protein-cysteine methyltransferase-like protein